MNKRKSTTLIYKGLKGISFRRQRQLSKAGLAPGSVVFTGEQKLSEVDLKLFHYDAESYDEYPLSKDELHDGIPLKRARINWLSIAGVHDTQVIETIGKHFNLHPLTLEDIAHVGQRPKIDIFDNYLYISMRLFSMDDEGMQNEQFNLVLGRDFVLTFQEIPRGILEPLKQRIRQRKGRIRQQGHDYLAYALIDSLVDSYFGILEHFQELLEDLELQINAEPSPEHLERINHLKYELLALRRAFHPMRELFAGLKEDGEGFLSETVLTYLEDARDHSQQVTEGAEAVKDMVTGLHDTYMTNLSFKMNEVMQLLTIIATIFIPLSFIVGVYGMNFPVMPELQWRYSYGVFWLGVILIVAGMIWYFKRKKWF